MGSRGKEAAADARRFLKLYGYRANNAPYQAVAAVIALRDAGLTTEADEVIAEGRKKIEPGHWVHTILRFLAGELSSELFLKEAKNNDQKTESHVYIGFDLKLKGRSEEALEHFRWVRKFGNAEFVEYMLAIAELGR